MSQSAKYYDQVYAIVRLVPAGQVASYGMVASLLPGVTARMVGYAMAGVPRDTDIPWQRIINSGGKISARPGSGRQYDCLKAEGVAFSASGRVCWADVRWEGPEDSWLDEAGMDMLDYLDIRAGWPK